MKRICGLLLLLSLLIIGCSQEADVFTLGFIPAERAEEFTPKAQELATFLSERMGKQVEIVVPSAYEPLFEGLRFGHLDASFMDSGPGWLAYQNAGAEVVLAELKDGRPFYYGEVFVRKDSDLASLEDVAGRTIAFTSLTGSSGFVLPVGTMVQRGIVTPSGDDFIALESALQDTFENYIVSGGYKQSLTLLVDGKVDVAGGAHDALEIYLDEDQRSQLKTLERLGKVPSHPIMVGGHVSAEDKDAFVAAMLQLNEPENIHILKNLYGVEGVIVANTQDHLGDFGPAFDALKGVQEKILAKRK